ncbi:CBS domain-containing protein [Methanobrevibacter woesei]|uniref:CBS domain-containing protein n=1 Tax=Methanobrevibacter woesei TaxID=190976 RepID=UPI0026DF0D18|nr:CBS domain-containing protein [Methanobrevibacter woesei]
MVTAERDTSVIEISKIMSETGLQRIPVVEDGNLVGLVTQSCIIKAVANMFKP